MKNDNELYKKIMSEENIFAAIYSLESYIFERNLLNDADLVKYFKLKDKYNTSLIKETIQECKYRLQSILTSDEFFNIQVFFKMKKLTKDNKNNSVVECRPMHTADLITQICIVCMLNIIMFKESDEGKRQLSDLSQLLPSNFYGNIPSITPEKIFYNWKDKYKEYSENVINTFDVAKESGLYKYEVTLDLKNFFPSINPLIIYNYILKKVRPIYGSEDFEAFKVVLKKLLYFNISNLNDKQSLKEYYGESYEENLSYHPNIGIPQGLPQSYFFGNICMILVSEKFNEMFPGKSFFYVDDSVIYTNDENADEQKFTKSLIKLNKKIENLLRKYENNAFEKDNDLISLSNNMEYKVCVHVEDKSSTSKVMNVQKMNKAFLTPIALEASRASFEINSTIDELEDNMLSEKIDTLSQAVELEIHNVKKAIEDENNDKITAFNVYLKTLKRYKKFFLYRKRLLDFRTNKNIKDIKNTFEETYMLRESELTDDNIENIFPVFEENIFLAEAQLIYSNLVRKDEKEIFKRSIENFEHSILKDLPYENLYFKENFKDVDLIIDEYDSLDQISRNRLPNHSKSSLEDCFLCLEQFDEESIKELFGFGIEYDKYIYKHSNEYRRKIANAYISRIFNVALSDDPSIKKTNKRNVTYNELRLFVYIRNHNCKMSDFKEFLLKLLSVKNEREKIDYGIYEVLYIFIKYVKIANKIDDLVLIHKYIASIWKNGSRFLYFYTLHNQEHSVELIKSVVNICKTIDYFQIKNEDYYILFLSCYLHDISMVLQPDVNTFVIDNFETDKIYTDFCIERQNILNNAETKEDIKKLMKISFEKVGQYFESLTRDKHATNSAKFIRNSRDLDFLGDEIKQFVASVSEAHAFNPNDVYGLKSKAKSENISEKYIMILLRLADLLDISKDRVSLNILKYNISNMPESSQFHWVTHAITDEYKIYSSYKFNGKAIDEGDFETVIKPENLKEIITVEIKLNASNLTDVQSLKCQNVNAVLDTKSRNILVSLKDGECQSDNCNFLCKWFFSKNNYLQKELNALKLYLHRNSNNIFHTNINIKLNFENSMSLPDNYYDIVNKEIN